MKIYRKKFIWLAGIFALWLMAFGCERSPIGANLTDGGVSHLQDGGSCQGQCCERSLDAGLPCGVEQEELENNGGIFRVQFCKADAGCATPQKCSETLIDLIHSARHSIHALIYDFSLEPIADALVSAAFCGRIDGGTLDIKIVIDKNHQNETIINKLQGAGISFVFCGTAANEMHDKVLIADNKVGTGSFNWTKEADDDNDENLLLSHSEEVARSYEIKFNDIWNKAIDGGLIYDDGGAPDAGYKGERINSFVETSFCPEKLCKYDAGLINCPEPHCINKVLALIRSAQESVHIAANWLTLAAIKNELLLAKNRGVAVQIIFSRLSACGNGSDFAELRERIGCNNIVVDKKRQYGEMHHKFMIIDGNILLTGSMNGSDSAKNNDENTIIVNSTALADKYEREFRRMFDQGEKRCYCVTGTGLKCDSNCN